MPKITKRLVDRLPAGAIAWDGEMPGFGVRCLASGRRVYVLKYRVGKGRAARQRWYTIGQHGAPYTPETARREATRLLGRIVGHDDPQAQRHDDLNAETVAAFCERYLQDADKGLVTYRGKSKRPSTLATDAGRIERHILPLLGRSKIRDVRAADVERFMRDVAAGKTAVDVKTGFRGRAIVTGGTGTARRAVGLLGSIMSYAVRLGLRPDNPVRGVEQFRDQRRERHLSAPELRRLGLAIDAYAANDGNQKAADVARLLALTGCRRGEICGLRVSEIDLQGSCLRLEDTKTGRNVRPIGQPAKTLLRHLANEAAGEYLFPNERADGPYAGFGKEWRKIRDAAKLPKVTPHTLRHTFASVAANEFELSGTTIAALLGHRSAGITERYVHRVDAPLIAAANKVARWIDDAMAGREASAGGVVVDLPAARH